MVNIVTSSPCKRPLCGLLGRNKERKKVSDSTTGYLQIHSRGYLQMDFRIYLQIHTGCPIKNWDLENQSLLL